MLVRRPSPEHPALDRRTDAARKGRGAVSNRTGRFETQERIATADGWDMDPDADAPRLGTTLVIDAARRIVTFNSSPDIPFDRSINPYKGCEHGCVYCFARPTHAWLGLSPGLDFETRLFHKPDAPELLAAELADPKYRPATMALGTNTDPYQPVERETRLTRRILEVLAEHRHPFSIVTKSALVVRDLDIIAPMAAADMATVAISVTTLDRDLARRMEPRAATPPRRLEAIRALAAAGVPTAVMAAPMIPALNDMELEAILDAAAAAGATGAGYVLLRLPLEIRDLFVEWLEAHVPDRASRVMRLVRDTRGGRDYSAQWGARMRGTGPYAELLRQRFRLAVARLGLNRRRHDLDVSQFRRPPRAGDQMSLF